MARSTWLEQALGRVWNLKVCSVQDGLWQLVHLLLSSIPVDPRVSLTLMPISHYTMIQIQGHPPTDSQLSPHFIYSLSLHLTLHALYPVLTLRMFLVLS